MPQGSLLEGISDGALAVMAMCACSVVWFLGSEISKASSSQDEEPESPGPSGVHDWEWRPALEALYAYMMGRPEPSSRRPAGVRRRSSASGGGGGGGRRRGAGRRVSFSSGHPECPICLDDVSYAVETACGHAFCGKCFCEYWQETNGCRRRLNCPMDRRVIYSAYPSEALRARDRPDDPATMPAALFQERANVRQRIDQSLRLYNSMFGSDTSFELLRWIARAFRQWEQIPLGLRTYFMLLLFVVFLYFIFPFDIVPETALGPAGLIDDLLLLAFVLCHLGGAYRAAVVIQGIHETRRRR